jgi:two-component system, chemotaxis family, chemotaxis protein CheY
MSENLRVLIVDDSSVIRRSIERYLLQAGVAAEFFTASNGELAVEQFKLHRPHVMTLDITMPEMDGLTCLDELMAIDENIKVLVISALADTETAVEALTRGATNFVCKPFNAEEVSGAVKRLIDQVDFSKFK